MRARSSLLVAAASTLLLSAAVLVAPGAQATAYPGTPTGMHQVSATPSSMTVAVTRAANAQSYRLYVSTVRSDMYVANIRAGHYSSARHNARSTSTTITVGGLPFTTAPFYYRVAALNGSYLDFTTTIGTGGVQAAMPTALAAHVGHGISLSWSSGAATGFTIAQATSADMYTNRIDWTITGSTHQFTPSGLLAGTTYYFAVRANNNGPVSKYSAHASGVSQGTEQRLRVMTYNVLQLDADGTQEYGQTVSPWSQRGPAAASLIAGAHPDAVAVQEAGDWATPYSTRQVDTLQRSLGSDYQVAHTEVTWAEHLQGRLGYIRTHSYILFRTSTYEAVGEGGHWDLDGSAAAQYHAAWQVLRNRTTGATFLFVSTHLVVGYSSSLDLQREHETQSLIAQANAKAASAGGIRIVYAGDFNSNLNRTNHPLDGPGTAMRTAGAGDSFALARTKANQYDSFNGYQRTPSPYNYNTVDHIFAPAGVAPTGWDLALHLSAGKVVGVMASDHFPVYVDLGFYH